MEITRIHPITGAENVLELDITQEQLDRYSNGEFLPRVAPNLTPDEREFLSTGLLPGEGERVWNLLRRYMDEQGLILIDG